MTYSAPGCIWILSHWEIPTILGFLLVFEITNVLLGFQFDRYYWQLLTKMLPFVLERGKTHATLAEMWWSRGKASTFVTIFMCLFFGLFLNKNPLELTFIKVKFNSSITVFSTGTFQSKISARRRNCDSRAWWISAQVLLSQKVTKNAICQKNKKFMVWWTIIFEWWFEAYWAF